MSHGFKLLWASIFCFLLLLVGLSVIGYTQQPQPQPQPLTCEDRLVYTARHVQIIEQERREKAEAITILLVDKEKLTEKVKALEARVKELEVKIDKQKGDY